MAVDSPIEAHTTKSTADRRDRKLALALFEQMLLIRIFESRGGELCRKGEISSFLHLYIGEEATAVGICSALRATDVITSTHRGHGHVLAKGADPDRVMAELFARASGYCGGRGGSMHIFCPEVGVLGTNGLVGAGIPLAVGAALTAKLRRTGGVGVAFFGDGAVNHGAFHEAANIAAAWDLPAILVCENNLYATATPLSSATRNTDVASRGPAYSMPSESVDGQDVWAVREAAIRAVDRARCGEGPTLLEAKTYRFVAHNEGDPVVGTYRTQEELDAWKLRCPIELLQSHLVGELGVSDSEIANVRENVAGRVESAIEFARNSPWPEASTVLDHVLCEK